MGIAQKRTVASEAEDILELVRILPPEKRRTLSVELAARADAPHDLILFLAQDEILIAEPVILESPVLTDEDLLLIAKFGSPAHLARLRQRTGLPDEVLRVLDTPGARELALIRKLRDRSLEEFRATFVDLAGEKAEIALEELHSGNAGPLAVLCRDAGLSRAAYSSIVLLSDIAHIQPPDMTQSLLEAFETAHAA